MEAKSLAAIGPVYKKPAENDEMSCDTGPQTGRAFPIGTSVNPACSELIANKRTNTPRPHTWRHDGSW